VGLAGVLVAGCGAAATPTPAVPPSSPAPTGSASPAASATSVSSPTAAASATTAPSPAPTPRAIALREAPANLGCDAIGVDYTRMTFRIDPGAAEQVIAATDTSAQLLTYWSPGFRQAPGGERAIVDPAGKVVVTDGQVLEKPAAAYPRLAGYFVCLAPTAIYVLLTDPA
jgi:hypothetical protein